MRDIVVTLVVFGAVPLILVKPWLGVIVWSWLGYMNPHRLTWGFAYSMPFAQVTAIATLLGLLLSREKLRIPWSLPVQIMVVLNLWMAFTTLFAVEPTAAMDLWLKTIKIQLMVFVTLSLINDRKKLDTLVWTIALSLGYYGVKGGIFTLRGGGVNQVLGPEGSFFGGNTETGLVLVMALPLIRYLQLNADRKWLRLGLGAAMLLTGVAILGTSSRGALLGGAAMAALLWLKSRKKAGLLLAMLVVIPPLLAFMPESWHAKMGTIETYEEDTSAMGRIVAWQFATKLALQRPIGGGFGCFTPEAYTKFAPELVAVNDKYQDAHSIYFQVLGNHGFIGLAMYIALLIATWRHASGVMRLSKAVPHLKWAYDIAAMCQVSMVGFMVAGAFLGLAYFDLIFSLIALVVVARSLVEQDLAGASTATAPVPGTRPDPVFGEMH